MTRSSNLTTWFRKCANFFVYVLAMHQRYSHQANLVTWINRHITLGIACWLSLMMTLSVSVNAQKLMTTDGASPSASAPRRLALIVVGLPGDQPHAEIFQATTRKWVAWLTGSLSFAPENVIVLSGREPAEAENRGPATAAAIEQRVTAIKQSIGADDTLWVFFLGHANDEDGRAFFHLPGPDLDNRRIGELFAGIECREQVFWLTHTCSGMCIKPLSKPGRIVIAATLPDAEINETEFPHALTTITSRAPRTLDADGDDHVSVAELFSAIVREVESMFQADNRTPTEHALLDDNGDGKGTEAADLARPSQKLSPETAQAESVADSSNVVEKPPDTAIARRDGLLAAATYLPIKIEITKDNMIEPERPPEPLDE
jgi:hypothetical protein